MFKKSIILSALALGLFVPAFSQGHTTDSGDITITATVETYFEWDGSNVFAIDKDTGWTGGTGVSTSHIGKPGDSITANHVFIVNTNTDPSFNLATVAGGNAGVLTEGGSTTLTTSYQINTASVGTIAANGSSTLLDAAGAGVLSAFDASNTWTLTHDASGQSNLNLEVHAAIPGGVTLPKAADYTCKIKITATW